MFDSFKGLWKKLKIWGRTAFQYVTISKFYFNNYTESSFPLSTFPSCLKKSFLINSKVTVSSFEHYLRGMIYLVVWSSRAYFAGFPSSHDTIVCWQSNLIRNQVFLFRRFFLFNLHISKICGRNKHYESAGLLITIQQSLMVVLVPMNSCIYNTDEYGIRKTVSYVSIFWSVIHWNSLPLQRYFICLPPNIKTGDCQVIGLRNFWYHTWACMEWW